MHDFANFFKSISIVNYVVYSEICLLSITSVSLKFKLNQALLLFENSLIINEYLIHIPFQTILKKIFMSACGDVLRLGCPSMCIWSSFIMYFKIWKSGGETTSESDRAVVIVYLWATKGKHVYMPKCCTHCTLIYVLQQDFNEIPITLL